MKKYFPVFCFLLIIQFAKGQDILQVQTASINDLKAVILPTYDNLFKLLRATDGDYLATIKSFNYFQRKADDPEYRLVDSDGEIYNITKQEKQVDIFFSAETTYPQEMKDVFLARFPDAKHKSMDKGVEAYYLDLMYGGGKLHYWVLFDITKGSGGGVTILDID